MLPETTEKFVGFTLTADEKREIADKLARQIEGRKRLEDEKKALTSELAAKINEATAQINSLAGLLTTGIEMRLTECNLTYDAAARIKIVTAPDGKEVDRIRLENWEMEELKQLRLQGM
jgi:hypothetical protein